MHLLRDAIDLKQSLKGTIKVLGKSLTEFFDKVYFIVDLYGFPLPLVEQANPFFPMVSHLPQLSDRRISKPNPYFSFNPSFSRMFQLSG